jgi:GNAT superfamily N-acetyltransferase
MTSPKENNLKLKKAKRKDVPLILSLIKELAEFEKLSHQVVASEKDLTNNLFGPKKFAEVLLAFYDKEPAGMALFFHNYSTFEGKPGIYLEDLFVKPEFRGKGIGKSLLLKLIGLAEKRKCGRVEWAVLDWNQSAIDFYSKLGAECMDSWKIFRLTNDKIKMLNNSSIV